MNPRIPLLLAVVLPIGSAFPQARRSPPPPTVADYGRADSILLLRSGLLKNRIVIPNWLEPNDQFWYRRETGTGTEFVIVDAGTGRKRPAFDAEALAARVAKVTAVRVKADSLPLDSLRLQGDATLPLLAYLTVATTRVRCRLQPEDYACEPLAPLGTELLPSPDGRLAVFTKGPNLWLRDLGTNEERALTTDGVSEDFGYAINVDGIGTIPRRRAEALGRRSPPAGVVWSPDSRTVIVPFVDQRHVAYYPLIETVPADGSFRPKVHLERRALLG